MSSPTTEIEVSFVFFKGNCAAEAFFSALFKWEFTMMLLATINPFRNTSAIGFSSLWQSIITIIYLGFILTAIQGYKYLMTHLFYSDWMQSGELRSRFEDLTKLRKLGFLVGLLIALGPDIIAAVFISGLGNLTFGAIFKLILEVIVLLYTFLLLPFAFTPALEQSADILCGGGTVTAKD